MKIPWLWQLHTATKQQLLILGDTLLAMIDSPDGCRVSRSMDQGQSWETVFTHVCKNKDEPNANQPA